MGAFAEVARHDPRPLVADAAAAALVEVVEAHCRGWDEPCWQAAHVRSMPLGCRAPKPPYHVDLRRWLAGPAGVP